MERIYHHYTKWEDFNHGLYNEFLVKDNDMLIKNCIDLLTDCERFYNIMLIIIKEWKHSSEVNLTNTSRNRQAWLGQASCCYNHAAPEFVTKKAWRMLSKDEQFEANKTADEIIFGWEEMHNYNIKNKTNYSFEDYKKEKGKQTELNLYA